MEAGGGPGACWPRHAHLKGGGGMVHCGLQPGERARGPRTLQSRGASGPFAPQRRWGGGQTGEETVHILTGDKQGTSERRWLGVRGGGWPAGGPAGWDTGGTNMNSCVTWARAWVVQGRGVNGRVFPWKWVMGVGTSHVHTGVIPGDRGKGLSASSGIPHRTGAV